LGGMVVDRKYEGVTKINKSTHFQGYGPSTGELT